MFRIKTFFGPMGSGKTKKLLEMYESIYRKDLVKIFSCGIDDRWGKGVIKSRDGKLKLNSIVLHDLFLLLQHLDENTKHVFVDEVNFFFSEENPEKGIDAIALERSRHQMMKILLALAKEREINFNLFGLNLTAEKKSYGFMGTAMHYSEKHELFAECACCGNEKAQFTFYIPYEKKVNVVGADDYCALCGLCWFKWEENFKWHKSQNNLDEYFKLAKVLKPNGKK